MEDNTKIGISFDVISNKPGILSGTAYSLFNIKEGTITIKPAKLTNLYHAGIGVFDSTEFSAIASNFINQCILSVSNETQAEIVETIERLKEDPMLARLVKLDSGTIRMNFVIVLGNKANKEDNKVTLSIADGSVTTSVIMDPE